MKNPNTQPSDKRKKNPVVEFLSSHAPCRNCGGYVPDGAIYCVHCGQQDPVNIDDRDLVEKNL